MHSPTFHSLRHFGTFLSFPNGVFQASTQPSELAQAGFSFPPYHIMVIHKYPVVGQTYVPIDPSERQPKGISSVKVLRTLDNATFLATKIPNTVCADTRADPQDKITVPLATCLLPTAGTSMSLLLNHPNIISIIDIVQNSQIPGRDEEKGEWSDIAVWEDMNAGCLSYILPSTNTIPAFSDTYAWDLLSVENFHRFSLPESLCWHVLKSISRALLWLHHGLKERDGIPNDWQKHDDDWHAVLIMDVSPSQIWFKHPRGKEMYGVCKLGGFGETRVCGSTGANVAVANRKEDAPFYKKLYWPPVSLCFSVTNLYFMSNFFRWTGTLHKLPLPLPRIRSLATRRNSLYYDDRNSSSARLSLGLADLSDE